MIRIGTSGWAYREWEGSFYPSSLPRAQQLAHLSSQLSTVEINGSFYSLQRPTSYQKWSAQTPDGFFFAVKGGRYITHLKRLRDPEVPLANFFASGVLALGPKLGPILWQLPATVPFECHLMADFLGRLPVSTTAAAELAAARTLPPERTWLDVDQDRPLRYAIEVRHDSFRSVSFTELLREFNVALVAADTAGTWPYFEDTTADFAYVRLHGHTELYVSAYSTKTLTDWAGKIHRWAGHGDVYVYFDNTAKAAAPVDAQRLAELLDVHTGTEGRPIRQATKMSAVT